MSGKKKKKKSLPTSLNVILGFLKAIWIERVTKSQISWKSPPLYGLRPPAWYRDDPSVVSCGHLCFYSALNVSTCNDRHDKVVYMVLCVMYSRGTSCPRSSHL